mmetsp:Transcript_2037/g.5869  ORF Transcript_2037/g.5869 Transcript_2037/m.5869 type:complete len:124 (-) Transcript_2037:1041-1412(-)
MWLIFQEKTRGIKRHVKVAQKDPVRLTMLCIQFLIKTARRVATVMSKTFQQVRKNTLPFDSPTHASVVTTSPAANSGNENWRFNAKQKDATRYKKLSPGNGFIDKSRPRFSMKDGSATEPYTT